MSLTASRVRSLLTTILTIAALATPVLSQAGQPQPLTDCDQELVGDLYLAADLNCTGADRFGVKILGGSTTLELRGFAIRGAWDNAVECRRSCTIVGPGTIESNGAGIRSLGRLRVLGVTIRDNGGAAVSASSVLVVDSQIEGSYAGISAGRSARLVNSSVTGADGTGVQVGGKPSWRQPCRGRTSLENSTVTGNVINPQPSSCPDGYGCADIESCREPEIDETSSCGTSIKYDANETWGLCALD